MTEFKIGDEVYIYRLPEDKWHWSGEDRKNQLYKDVTKLTIKKLKGNDGICDECVTITYADFTILKSCLKLWGSKKITLIIKQEKEIKHDACA